MSRSTALRGRPGPESRRCRPSRTRSRLRPDRWTPRRCCGRPGPPRGRSRWSPRPRRRSRRRRAPRRRPRPARHRGVRAGGFRVGACRAATAPLHDARSRGASRVRRASAEDVRGQHRRPERRPGVAVVRRRGRRGAVHPSEVRRRSGRRPGRVLRRRPGRVGQAARVTGDGGAAEVELCRELRGPPERRCDRPGEGTVVRRARLGVPQRQPHGLPAVDDAPLVAGRGHRVHGAVGVHLRPVARQVAALEHRCGRGGGALLERRPATVPGRALEDAEGRRRRVRGVVPVRLGVGPGAGQQDRAEVGLRGLVVEDRGSHRRAGRGQALVPPVLPREHEGTRGVEVGVARGLLVGDAVVRRPAPREQPVVREEVPLRPRPDPVEGLAVVVRVGDEQAVRLPLADGVAALVRADDAAALHVVVEEVRAELRRTAVDVGRGRRGGARRPAGLRGGVVPRTHGDECDTDRDDERRRGGDGDPGPAGHTGCTFLGGRGGRTGGAEHVRGSAAVIRASRTAAAGRGTGSGPPVSGTASGTP
ncbi:hypothetical protein Cus16_1033 [Curtobacterium sp. ER1/6]|nr:hypothetical protein Cus16_1033 [Curtobacterium sp. ER1/6]